MSNPSLTEREIQRLTVRAWKKMGVDAFVTSSNVKSRCTKGTPDVFANFSSDIWTGIEFKSETGALSDAQSKRVKAGTVYVIRSVEQGIKLAMDKRNVRTIKVRGTVQ